MNDLAYHAREFLIARTAAAEMEADLHDAAIKEHEQMELELPDLQARERSLAPELESLDEQLAEAEEAFQQALERMEECKATQVEEEEKAAAAAAKVQELTSALDQEMSIATPGFFAGCEQLAALTPGDFSDLRQLRNPPSGTRKVPESARACSHDCAQ